MIRVSAMARAAIRSCTVLIGWAVLSIAQGSNLQVAPVKVDISSAQLSSSVTLRNPGRAPIYGQVRVFAWDQIRGEESLRPATDLIASPPLLELGIDGVQLVRLVRTSTAPPSRELSYRLLVDEIADPETAPANGVAIQLRYSIPVFVATQSSSDPHPPAWTLSRHKDQWVLRLENTGPTHLQVGALTLIDAMGVRLPVSEGLMGYALAERYREWQLPKSVVATLSPPVHVEALINGRPSTTVATTQ